MYSLLDNQIQIWVLFLVLISCFFLNLRGIMDNVREGFGNNFINRARVQHQRCGVSFGPEQLEKGVKVGKMNT